MKKTLIFTLLFMLPTFVFGQNYFTATPTRLLPENNIVELPGKSSSEIYNALKTWTAKTYKNPDYVLKSDVANEYLRLNGLWNIMSRGPFGKSAIGLKYTLTLDIKDGKLRYNIDELTGVDNFSYNNCYKSNGERRTTKEVVNYLNDIELHADKFINELIGSINHKEDW